MKKVGEFNGVPVYPNAPPGIIFFMNEKQFSQRIDARTRWQRLKDWLKRLYKAVLGE